MSHRRAPRWWSRRPRPPPRGGRNAAGDRPPSSMLTRVTSARRICSAPSRRASSFSDARTAWRSHDAPCSAPRPTSSRIRSRTSRASRPRAKPLESSRSYHRKVRGTEFPSCPRPRPRLRRRDARSDSPRLDVRLANRLFHEIVHENHRSLSLTRYLSSSPPETLSRLETGVRRHRGRRRHTVRDEAPDHQPAAGGSALLGRREVRPRLVQGDGGCGCGRVPREAPRVCGARRRGAPRRAFGTSSDGKSRFKSAWW